MNPVRRPEPTSAFDSEFYKNPQSEPSNGVNELINRRLEALIEAKNSLELAEKDLSFRGPGEIYGYEQSGFFKQFKLARFSDTELIKKAKEAACLSLPLFEKKFPSLSPELDKIIYLE